MNKKLGIVLILVLLVGAVFLAGCQGRTAGKRIIVPENTTDIREGGTQVLLTLGINPAIGGRITLNPYGEWANGYYYYLGTEVIIRATPNRGYRFLQWTGDVWNIDVNSPTVTVVMDQDKSITANFGR